MIENKRILPYNEYKIEEERNEKRNKENPPNQSPSGGQNKGYTQNIEK